MENRNPKMAQHIEACEFQVIASHLVSVFYFRFSNFDFPIWNVQFRFSIFQFLCLAR
jgi:hypothetical protein